MPLWGFLLWTREDFALEIRSNDDYQQFLKEFKAADNKSEFHNKWFKFETYRRIVCTDNFWMI